MNCPDDLHCICLNFYVLASSLGLFEPAHRKYSTSNRQVSDFLIVGQSVRDDYL